MEESVYTVRPIAQIHTDLPSKFGIPRQSGLVEDLRARVVFSGEYRNEAAVRGLEGFSHLWLLWLFSEAIRENEVFSPTVRPPRLGGNSRVGVFASRSPFRPNHIGLSAVRLERIEYTKTEGPVLHVLGADLMDGTPILDVKPYLPYTDSHPEASAGFASEPVREIPCEIPDHLLARVPCDKQAALRGILSRDPRPSYQDDPDRVYGMPFAGLEVRFRVSGGVVTVLDVLPGPGNT